MKYVIPGAPVPLMRPRFTAGQRPWDAQKKIKASAAIVIASQHRGRAFFDGPVSLDITFYFSTSRGNLVGKHHYYKPDLSNLIKFVEDVAEAILYGNDCIIASIIAKKLYDYEARTEFIITQLQ